MNRARLAYRKLRQRIRRWVYSFDTPWRRRLYARKQALASLILLTPEERDRLAAINWTLGNGYVYDKLSDAEAAQQRATAERIIQKLRGESDD